MKFKEKIKIDFQEFFTTGKFDFLELGKTKDWIINNFPNPDGYPKTFKDSIWTYGNIELHFNKNKLFLIFSDYINELDGGEFFELNKWFLEDTQKLKLLDIISELNCKGIDFQKVTNNIYNTINLKLKSGVTLSFYLYENINEENEIYLERCKNTSQNEFKLNSFSLYKKDME